jgi:hypothetical protein
MPEQPEQVFSTKIGGKLPKIPVREEQVGVSGLVAPVSQSQSRVGGDIKIIGVGLTQLGRVAAAHAEKIQGEHDIASTQSAINAFSGEALNQMSDHLNRKGANAKGSLKEYDEWYNKKSSEAQSKLKNARQKQMFSSFTSTQKRNDNKSLSVHQARQHQVHMESVIPSSLSIAKQSVVLTPFNDDVINTQIVNVTVAIENARKGLDNTADIAKAEADIKLVALAAMTQQDPLTAEKKLNEWKDDLGAAYTTAKDIIDKDVVHIKAKAKFPGDFKKQTEWVDKQKGVSTEVIRSVNTRIRGEKAAEDRLEAEAVEETTQEWAGLLERGALTDEAIRLSNVPNKTKNIWYAKLAGQTAARTTAQKEKFAAETKELYADTVAIVDLKPETITPTDIHNLTDPVSGGLTGQQASFLVDRRNKNLSDKAVAEDIKKATASIMQKFNRGDFGRAHGKEKTTRKARTTKADLIIALQEWTQANLGQDPTEWLNSKIDLVAAEDTAKKLDSLFTFEMFLPGVPLFRPGTGTDEFKQEVARGERDQELLERMLRRDAPGHDITSFSDEDIESFLKSTKFNEFKTEILGE